MAETRDQWKEENDRIETKIDSLIALEKERLSLEREKLEFKKKLLALQENKGQFGFT